MQQHKSVHKLPDIDSVLIDGFHYSLNHIPKITDRHYFLTHYHSDHYTGLHTYWNDGIIYCSSITANLLKNVMKLQNHHLIQARELNQKYSLNHDIDYTFLDANHSPGAIMILFHIKSSQTYHLHTGDMRFHERMRSYPALQNINIDQLYLDTTYAHPKHSFIPQDIAINKMIMMMREFFNKHDQHHGIVYIGTYNLGKERILQRICEELLKKPNNNDPPILESLSSSENGKVSSDAPPSSSSSPPAKGNSNKNNYATPSPSSSSSSSTRFLSKIYLDKEKYLIFQQIPELLPYFDQGFFTINPFDANIHIVSMNFAGWIGSYFQPKFEFIEQSIKQLNEEKYKYLCEPKELNHHQTKTTSPSSSLYRPSMTTPSPPTNTSPSSTAPSFSATSFPICPVEFLLFTHALVFIPTGWADSSNYNKSHAYQEKDNISVQLIPYSEHSSYPELVEFVKFIKPREIVPTVYTDDKNRLYILQLFHSYVDHTANLKKFISKFDPANNIRRDSLIPSSVPSMSSYNTSPTTPAVNKKRKSQYNISMDDREHISRCNTDASIQSLLIPVKPVDERYCSTDWSATSEVMPYEIESSDDDDDEEGMKGINDRDMNNEGAVRRKRTSFTATFLENDVNELERKISTGSMVIDSSSTLPHVPMINTVLPPPPPVPITTSPTAHNSPKPLLQKQVSFNSQYGLFTSTGMSKIFNLGIKDAQFNLRIEIPHSNISNDDDNNNSNTTNLLNNASFPYHNSSNSNNNNNSNSMQISNDYNNNENNSNNSNNSGSSTTTHYSQMMMPMGNNTLSQAPLSLSYSRSNYNVVASPVVVLEKEEATTIATSNYIPKISLSDALTKTPPSTTHKSFHRSSRKLSRHDSNSSAAGSSSYSHRRSKSNTPEVSQMSNNTTDKRDLSGKWLEMNHLSPTTPLFNRSYSAPTETSTPTPIDLKTQDGLILNRAKLHLQSSSPSTDEYLTGLTIPPPLEKSGPTYHSETSYFDLTSPPSSTTNRITTSSKRGKVLKQLKLNDMMMPVPLTPSRSLPPSSYQNEKMFNFSSPISGSPRASSSIVSGGMEKIGAESGTLGKLNLNSPRVGSKNNSPDKGLPPTTPTSHILRTIAKESLMEDEEDRKNGIASPSMYNEHVHMIAAERYDDNGKAHFQIPTSSSLPSSSFIPKSPAFHSSSSAMQPAPSLQRLATTRYSSLSTTRNGPKKSNFTQLTPIDVNAVLGLNPTTTTNTNSGGGNNSSSSSISSTANSTDSRLNGDSAMRQSFRRSNSDELVDKLSLTSITEDSGNSSTNFLQNGMHMSHNTSQSSMMTTNTQQHDDGEVEVLYSNSRPFQTSSWTCEACTFKHEGSKYDHYLLCSVCGAERGGSKR